MKKQISLISILVLFCVMPALADVNLADYAENFDYKIEELKTYSDYKDELNYNTVVHNDIVSSLFLAEDGKFIEKYNLYCEEIHLAEIKEKTIAMMQIEGNIKRPVLYIFVYIPDVKKYLLYYLSGVYDSCKYIIPADTEEETKFVEKITDFDTKKVLGYNLYDFIDRKWVLLDSTR